MTTNPSNTRKRSPRKAAAPTSETTNVVELPKRKRTSKRTADSVKADVVEALAAELPKARKRAAKAAAAPVVETPAPKGLDAEQVAVLQTLASALADATREYEDEIVRLLNAGVSPTHIGAPIHVGNSSIRRIGWRHGWSNA